MTTRRDAAQALRSLFFGLRFWYPHLRQEVDRTAFRALQRMQILTLRSLSSASANRAIQSHHVV